MNKVKRLGWQDIITIWRMVQKVGIPTMQSAMRSGGNMLSALTLILAVPDAEEDINRLLCSLTGQNPQQVNQMSPEAVMSVIETMIDQEDWDAVFGQARGLLKKLGIDLDKFVKDAGLQVQAGGESSTASGIDTDTNQSTSDPTGQPQT